MTRAHFKLCAFFYIVYKNYFMRANLFLFLRRIHQFFVDFFLTSPLLFWNQHNFIKLRQKMLNQEREEADTLRKKIRSMQQWNFSKFLIWIFQNTNLYKYSDFFLWTSIFKPWGLLYCIFLYNKLKLAWENVPGKNVNFCTKIAPEKNQVNWHKWVRDPSFIYSFNVSIDPMIINY